MSSSEIVWPTSRDEEWRYTSLKPFLKTEYRPLTSLTHSPDLVLPNELSAHLADDESVFVFYNGCFVEHLSRNLHDLNLTETSDAKLNWLGVSPFTELNLKMATKTRQIQFSELKKQKISLIYLYGNLYKQTTQPFVVYSRTKLKIPQGVRVELYEGHYAINNIQFHVNSISEVELAVEAELKHARQSWLGDHAVLIHQQRYVLAKQAMLSSLNSAVGSLISKTNIAVRLEGHGASARLDGVYLVSQDQHVENSTFIHHVVGETKSEQVFKGLLSGDSKASYTGRLVIEKDAQKSDASQLNQTLLLSDGAEMNTRPQLEVYADDVKAAHGASLGQLREDELFYLQSRAINKDKAFEMLAKGYVCDVLSRIDSKALEDRAQDLINRSLPLLMRDWVK